jgi:uncharacterized protein YndB with AHSA1/START domain
MARFEFSTYVDAPADQVFDLWTNLDRVQEWLVGLSKVTDRTGGFGQAGSKYVMWFSGRPAPVEVVEAERPRRIRTRLGGGIFQGFAESHFEPEGTGTRITEWFEPDGLGHTIAAWIFSKGSWKGSFKGELNTFKRIVEREARTEAGSV